MEQWGKLEQINARTLTFLCKFPNEFFDVFLPAFKRDNNIINLILKCLFRKYPRQFIPGALKK